MFGDVCGLVDKVRIGLEGIKSFDAVIVAQVMVDGFWGVVDFLGDGRRVFVFEEDLAHDHGLVRDGGAHILEVTRMGQQTIMFGFVALACVADGSVVAVKEQGCIPHGEEAALSMSFAKEPGQALTEDDGRVGALFQTGHVFGTNQVENDGDETALWGIGAGVFIHDVPEQLARLKAGLGQTNRVEDLYHFLGQALAEHGAKAK